LAAPRIARNRGNAEQRSSDVPERRGIGKREASNTLRAFLIELPVYAALVLIYFFLVLHFLGGWLGTLFAQHHVLYAVVALLLLVGQALLLDGVTSLLLALLRRRPR
jgi:hypothetical protein